MRRKIMGLGGPKIYLLGENDVELSSGWGEK